ncbi:MAG: YceI family protein [Pseudomonadota bacterium]
MLALSAAALAGGHSVFAQTAEAKAPQWAIVPGSERLEIQGRARDFEIRARFAVFQAEIAFQPGQPESASVSVVIDTTSWASSLPATDEQVLGPDWLSVAHSPTARWVLTELRATGGEAAYSADGVLTLQDRSAPVPLALTLEIDADGATLHAVGTGRLDRREFGLGANTAPDEGTAGYAVAIRFEFTAQRVAP